MQTINITSHYAWDQSDKIIELYVPIPKANEIKKDNYTLDVQARSIQLGVVDHQGANYNFKISNLCFDLKPEEFEIKFKSNKVVLYLQKKEIGKHWNDIKVKKVSDVYNQMQRQIDASQSEAFVSMTKDMEEKIINGYGPPAIQDAIKNAFENASPSGEKMASERQQ